MQLTIVAFNLLSRLMLEHSESVSICYDWSEICIGDFYELATDVIAILGNKLTFYDEVLR